uniref:Putative RNA polymerase II transcription factor B subunit 1-1 n=1 Tax=Noccaea caerulescens TaxID=107243 RepID=A0A1J3GM04_NOCCA
MWWKLTVISRKICCFTEYLYSTKNAAVPSAEAADDELLAVLLKPDEIAARETHRKIRRVDDMVADQADDYSHIMDVVEPQNDQFRR